ncbi:hypothetical protein H6G80_20365 [Nostoc sp. FACHB-87]|uniref:hypothetical protein n=1 Tax=Nostocaceae TaxID=1162 RepID=UPI00168277F7|nr:MULTISPECIES: hypothetical protein [Nostocaceae]MBD2456419.1 hypothetical protein [Nostoc sp. FACHB-87]MBD2474039.1 hypothetical protein [Anabaena sp. FACHB-83]
MKLCGYTIAGTLVTILVGAIANGCTSFATSNVQQSKSLNPPTTTNQAQLPHTSNPVSKLNLQAGMPYQKAREQVLQQGWQPNLQGDAPNLQDSSVKELYDFGYTEVKDCSGTGVGACRFEFTNQVGELLWISATIADRTNTERVVWHWSIEKNGNQQTSQSTRPEKPPFIGTRSFNFLGGSGTGQSIAIAPDGTTIVTLHGKFQSSIQYQGKFSNPIILQDGSGFGLLFKDGKVYSLAANGQIAKGCKGDATVCESALIAATSAPIKPGFYVFGGTDQGLEVKGEQYRYYDEAGEQEWRPISELNYIQENLIFDGKNYWCIPPRSEAGVCTENGWMPVR